MFTLGLAGGENGFDPLALLVIALALEALLGDAFLLCRKVPHPVAMIGALVEVLEQKLNRERRSQLDRALRGAGVVVFVAGPCAVIGFGIAWLTQHYRWGWIAELFCIMTLLAQKSLYKHVRAVGKALALQDAGQARVAVSRIVGRQTAELDSHGIARAAIESCAENFCDGVVAPVFWYALFGLPGLLAYKAANTMDSMIGHKTDRYHAFGMAAARLDDVLNLIPARLAGCFIVFASVFTPSAKPLSALKVMLRDARLHRSPNAGWPEGAMAGALGLSLAGPRRYAGYVVNEPWIGDGLARVTHHDIERSLRLYLAACLINALWTAAIAVLHYR